MVSKEGPLAWTTGLLLPGSEADARLALGSDLDHTFP